MPISKRTACEHRNLKRTLGGFICTDCDRHFNTQSATAEGVVVRAAVADTTAVLHALSLRLEALERTLGPKWTDRLATAPTPIDPPLGGQVGSTVVPMRPISAEDYDNEDVARWAPRWAWNTIDETLRVDAMATNINRELRDEIQRALDAMLDASENAED